MNALATSDPLGPPRASHGFQGSVNHEDPRPREAGGRLQREDPREGGRHGCRDGSVRSRASLPDVVFPAGQRDTTHCGFRPFWRET